MNLQSNKGDYQIILDIENTECSDMKTFFKNESYSMKISKENTLIKTDNFIGYLRAIESFSQIFHQNYNKNNNTIIQNIPIIIEDEPYMEHRGVMIDTARHFIKLDSLYKIIDVLQYNKMNILHIHFTDDESFPIQILQDQDITNYGSYSNRYTYTVKQLKQLVKYGLEAGVRIIPEIDSPSHTRSWGISEKWAPNLIICPGNGEHYSGQLDITMNSTYDLVNSVIQQIQKIFPDEYIHLGGDEVDYSCYDKRPSIKENMEKNMGVKNYVDLQVQYRNRQKDMLQKDRKPIFWANQLLNIPPGPTEIIHYWGPYDSLNLVKNVPNKLILSPEEYTYINKGMGFTWGQWFGQYLTWQKIYEFQPVPDDFPRDRILGAEICLWSEMNNSETTENYLWIRASAMAERLWNKEKQGQKNRVMRLIQMQKYLKNKEIKPSPVTSQFCENNLDMCFT